MKKDTLFAGFFLSTLLIFVSSYCPAPIPNTTLPIANHATPKVAKIQVAILLDVSNSMDGLIDQAKAQLWNMVSLMGKVRCNDAVLGIEIALYEYGRTNNIEREGFVKRISGFSTDLDGLSQKLFQLTTNGGDEYCGQVIYKSLNELNWDSNPENYKVIFIAGNEDFLQGNIHYTKACALANQKGIIVNTIYCGDRNQGIKEHWNLGGECGNGSFTNINSNAKIEEIPTPYDNELFSLNKKLNGTYIYYGENGYVAFQAQGTVDDMNMKMNKTKAAERVVVKGKKELYKNGGWDLVEATENDKTLPSKVDMKTLPDSLKKISRPELEKIVKQKSAERATLQKDIAAVNTSREKYIANERAKTKGGQQATLESEIEKTLRKQVTRYKMVIKE